MGDYSEFLKLVDTIIQQPECYMVNTVLEMHALKQAKPGDLCFVTKERDPKPYIYMNNEWHRSDVTSGYNEMSLSTVECPTCGAHSFISVGRDMYECEYCGNKYWAGTHQMNCRYEC